MLNCEQSCLVLIITSEKQLLKEQACKANQA